MFQLLKILLFSLIHGIALKCLIVILSRGNGIRQICVNILDYFLSIEKSFISKHYRNYHKLSEKRGEI